MNKITTRTLLLCLACNLLVLPLAGAVGPTLPSQPSRLKIFDQLVGEIERLDAQALQARSNRPESWPATTAKLRTELQNAESLFQMGRVFKRLAATYTNIHGRSFLAPELDEAVSAGAIHLPFQILPETNEGRDSKSPTFRLAKLESSLGSEFLGLEVVAINGKSMDQWSEENFLFCKYSLRWQCDLEITDGLQNELLSWHRHQPLKLTLRKNGKNLEISISPRIEKNPDENSFDVFNPPCGVHSNRYPGWNLKYKGFHVCAFESKHHPGVVLIRLRSFIYFKWKGDPALPALG